MPAPERLAAAMLQCETPASVSGSGAARSYALHPPTLRLMVWVAAAPVRRTCHPDCDPHNPVSSPAKPYPSLFTEAWSGWFAGVDQSPGHRPVSDLAYAIAKFVAEGGTLFNYCKDRDTLVTPNPHL